MKAPPLHQRIRAEIEAAIHSGKWEPGHKVPSEAELMAQYGCARMTVSKAITALAEAGLVTRNKRAGTVVARRQSESLVLDVPDLAAEVRSRGQAYAWRLIDQRSAAKSPGEGLGAALALIGIHFADGQPYAFEERWIARAALADLAAPDFAAEPPGSWLMREVHWSEAEHHIGACGASEVCARALDIAPGAPCLLIERQTWRGNQAVTFVRQYYAAGTHRLIARFGRSEPNAAAS